MKKAFSVPLSRLLNTGLNSPTATASSPTRSFDPLGLWYNEHYGPVDAVNDFIAASLAVNSFATMGFTISKQLGDFSLANDPVDHTGSGSFNNPFFRIASSAEIGMLGGESVFTDFLTHLILPD